MKRFCSWYICFEIVCLQKLRVCSWKTRLGTKMNWNINASKERKLCFLTWVCVDLAGLAFVLGSHFYFMKESSFCRGLSALLQNETGVLKFFSEWQYINLFHETIEGGIDFLYIEVKVWHWRQWYFSYIQLVWSRDATGKEPLNSFVRVFKPPLYHHSFGVPNKWVIPTLW